MRSEIRHFGLGLLLGATAPLMLLVRALDRHNRELSRLARELGTLSHTDPLTEIPNRRSFDDRLLVEIARANRYRTPLTLVMVDLDHFKALNDRFGHLFGDEVLRRVAIILDREKRLGDLVARVGGEEFAVLLPHTDAEAALAWAERARRAVAVSAAPPTEGGVRVTASFGVAEAEVPTESTEHLMAVADGALYAAKQLGRDRVVSASEERSCSPGLAS